MARQDPYNGFEQGPIRPPSEAGSLLVRVTRNCPWNKCTFCPVYKGSSFSLRDPEHVRRDIDLVAGYVHKIRALGRGTGKLYPDDIEELIAGEEETDRAALNAALQWAAGGMKSIFLQDANSLIIKPDDLIAILRHLKEVFPWVGRVTSYARSKTVAKIADEKLALMRDAGLSRIHIGMESGSDKVLEMVKKGVDKKTQIKAGQKIIRAGMELSEYIMPGLGGRFLSKEHALESADALNAINPDFIRLRTLAIPGHTELAREQEKGSFVKMGDLETAREIALFIENLDGISSYLKSDHILNLFEDLEGRFPEDKDRMLTGLNEFFALPEKEQMLYQVGRRTGMMRSLADLGPGQRRRRVEEICANASITPQNLDQVVDDIIRRFI